MAGAPIESVRRGVELFQQEAMTDPLTKQTAHVAIITFDSEARMVTNGLVAIEALKPPALTASGSTSLGKALTVLQQSMDKDIKPSVRGGEKGDWKPLVFILTDGEPTDEWQGPRQAILDRQTKKVVNVITVGCGPHLNEAKLKAISIGAPFRMDDSEASFKAFFQWVSQSVKEVSKSVSQAGPSPTPAAMPAAPPVLQYIP
jgi:uncharacterized protein YegL